MKLRLIGDVHAQMGAYRRLVKGSEDSIQLGDFGVGFILKEDLGHLEEHYPRHRFFSGNHDDDNKAKELGRYVESGWHADYGVFVLRGAYSIDKLARTPGYNWWPEEELDYKDMFRLQKEFAEVKPKIVLSHDFPLSASKALFLDNAEFAQKYGNHSIPSKTNIFLEKLFQEHQPEQWYGGHWHFSSTVEHRGTIFQCLNIDEVKDIET